MGKHELIEAFIRGDIDRRQFVSRLTMLGVSGGAALAYASRLSVDASAAPAGTAAGFKTRLQDGAADGDYGTAIAIGVLEALEQQSAAIRTLVLPLLRSLSEFNPGDFPPGALEQLETIRDHQQQHLEAVQALLESNGGTPETDDTETADVSDVDEFLNSLSENFDELTGIYAAIVPAVQNGEVRQTLMEAGSVASRHAALVSTFANRNPLPSAFQQPTIPTGI